MIRLRGTQEASSPASKQAKLGDQTRLLWASSSQFLNTSKDGNCISSVVKLFPCLAVLRAGSHVPLKQSSPPLLTWPVLQLPDYMTLTWTSPSLSVSPFCWGPHGCSIPDGLMSAAWKGIMAFLNLLTVLLLKQLIPNTCSNIFVQKHTTNL